MAGSKGGSLLGEEKKNQSNNEQMVPLKRTMRVNPMDERKEQRTAAKRDVETCNTDDDMEETAQRHHEGNKERLHEGPEDPSSVTYDGGSRAQKRAKSG